MLLLALALLVVAFVSGTLFGPLRSLQTNPNAFFGFIFAIVLGITVHEFMHAYTAHRLVLAARRPGARTTGGPGGIGPSGGEQEDGR